MEINYWLAVNFEKSTIKKLMGTRTSVAGALTMDAAWASSRQMVLWHHPGLLGPVNASRTIINLCVAQWQLTQVVKSASSLVLRQSSSLLNIWPLEAERTIGLAAKQLTIAWWQRWHLLNRQQPQCISSSLFLSYTVRARTIDDLLQLKCLAKRSFAVKICNIVIIINCLFSAKSEHSLYL